MRNWTIWTGLIAALTSLTSRIAAAQDVAGRPVEGGINFQAPVTSQAEDLIWLDNMLLYIIGAIVLFVMVLLVLVIVRYNARANPKPARFTHNAVLEVAWTAVPVLILIVIAIPSLRLLDKQLSVPEPDLTIKAIGNQWYWEYEYPDQDISFAAFMLGEEELEANGYGADEYLLAADTKVVVPVDKDVHVLVTAGDVIHAWTVPSFGVKVDAIPGRINEVWFRAEETGTYFGQCSELCGKDHAYMPIVVEVVSQEKYDAWVAEQTATKSEDAERDYAAAE